LLNKRGEQKSEEIEDEIQELEESMLPKARLDLKATCKSLAEVKEKARLLTLCLGIVSKITVIDIYLCKPQF